MDRETEMEQNVFSHLKNQVSQNHTRNEKSTYKYTWKENIDQKEFTKQKRSEKYNYKYRCYELAAIIIFAVQK